MLIGSWGTGCPVWDWGCSVLVGSLGTAPLRSAILPVEDGDELVLSTSVSLTSLTSGLIGATSSSLGALLTSFSISAISANCSNVVLRCSLPLELKSSAT